MRGGTTISAEAGSVKASAAKKPELGLQGGSNEHLDEPKPHIHATTFLAVFAVCLLYFTQNACIVGAGAQAQTIAAVFNDTASSSWITAALAIFTVVLGPIISQAADYWGRKWFLVCCSILGGVGELIVARSGSMSMVIAGFCVTGIAFGVQPLLHTVASEILPRRWRSYAQAGLMMSTGLGLFSGLVIGGAFNLGGRPDGFRNFSYTVMALYLTASFICVIAYRPPPMPIQAELSVTEKMSRLDWVGYGLYASSLVLFCLGLSYSQNPFEWSDAHVSAPFAVGLALAAGLIVYETKFKADGLFHHGLFQNNYNFSIALFCVFCEGIAFFAAITFCAFEIAVLWENDPFMVSVRFGIGFLATLVAALVTGLYTAVTKQLRWATVCAFIIFVIFFACMATADKTSSQHSWGFPIFLGWGLGMTIVTLMTAAQLSIPHNLIATASGIMISFRSLGGTIGIAIYNAVFASSLDQLSANVGAAAVRAGLPSESVQEFVGYLVSQNRTGLMTVPGITPQAIDAGANALLDTYTSGFRKVWVSAVGFVALAAIAACFLFDPKKEFNNHIDAPVEKEEDLYSAR